MDCCVRICQAPESQTEWIVRKHGAYEIDREESRLSSRDQTRLCETWILLSHGSTPIVELERDVNEGWTILDNEEETQKLRIAKVTSHPPSFVSKVHHE